MMKSEKYQQEKILIILQDVTRLCVFQRQLHTNCSWFK